MEFLGYWISAEGIKPLKKKVKAILDMPAPTSVNKLQVFLGGLNFYSRFLKDRAKIAEPLHRLLDKDIPWKWDQIHSNAYEQLKKQLASGSILCHFDQARPIVLSIDASPIE